MKVGCFSLLVVAQCFLVHVAAVVFALLVLCLGSFVVAASLSLSFVGLVNRACGMWGA